MKLGVNIGICLLKSQVANPHLSSDYHSVDWGTLLRTDSKYILCPLWVLRNTFCWIPEGYCHANALHQVTQSV